MYNRPNTERIQQLLEDGHDAVTARRIDRMERRENRLLDKQQGHGLTEDERGEIASLQAELREISGSPAAGHPSDTQQAECGMCGGSGTIDVDTQRGRIAHTCLCVDPGGEAYGVERVIRRLLLQRAHDEQRQDREAA